MQDKDEGCAVYKTKLISTVSELQLCARVVTDSHGTSDVSQRAAYFRLSILPIVSCLIEGAEENGWRRPACSIKAD